MEGSKRKQSRSAPRIRCAKPLARTAAAVPRSPGEEGTPLWQVGLPPGLWSSEPAGLRGCRRLTGLGLLCAQLSIPAAPAPPHSILGRSPPPPEKAPQ
ncbi:Hypothetical predicted protein [Podarcis lilfordi]|uniref:Uncharacterized protein n=1 Tax=Podarcis lilfordi TaxID=74358 RepID=A0AA35QQ75_9SAUR|nr:Hypothetical predicted protein [Podarcis lilfordi]